MRISSKEILSPLLASAFLFAHAMNVGAQRQTNALSRPQADWSAVESAR